MDSVVRVEYPLKSIALVVLEDRQYQNTFSKALVEGVTSAFDEINGNAEVKVVVVQGYGNYFCCGGTKEELLKIFEGQLKFTDFEFYRLLLDCELPTISAMQGHALGGGLVFGCYADLIVMAQECFYGANFMKYGFTPGMGATYIVPKKLGTVLGTEMLFTAGSYQGGDLLARGAAAKIVSKSEVESVALMMAEELANKPIESLKLLKHQLCRSIRAELPVAIAQEQAMHDRTFAQAEVKERINALF